MGYRASRTTFLLSAEYRANGSDLLWGIDGVLFDNSIQSMCNSAANEFQSCLMLKLDEYTNFYFAPLCCLYVND